MIWGPVDAGHGTLHEVKNLWTIDDLFDSLEVLAIKAERERRTME